MPPKKDAKKGGKAPSPTPGDGPGEGPDTKLLDTLFPVWDDKALPPDPKDGKYEDTEGLCVPKVMKKFVDTWKRPENLSAEKPVVPIVELKPPNPEDKSGKPGGDSGREALVEIFAGHDSVEWLRSVIYAIMERMEVVSPKDYLWELIYPQDNTGKPLVSAGGQYHVRLFVMDQWRRVTVDDRVPVDLFGRPVLVGAMPMQLWPLVLSKAILKVMATYQTLDCQFPNEVPAFLWLTGWLREDLPTTPKDGVVFERMFQALKEPRCITTVSLRERAAPEKPPPRMLVFCGPSGVGKGRLKGRILEEFGEKFGGTVSTTTRRPREHEVEGTDYFFSNRTEFKMMADDKRFLEWTEIAPRGLYGVGLDTVREVAATGRLCVMGIDMQGCKTLRANEAVDAMFVYVKPPSMEVLEERLRGRPVEAESTIQKRLMNAQEQMERADQEGLYDHVVINEEVEQVYMDIKEAISELSPVIRNRLRGLPAYVLDYADVIPSNQVEKAVLKPIVIAGPSNGGDKAALIKRLVEEFPDVFGFPVQTTTRPRGEDEAEGKDFYFVTEDKLEEGLKAGEYLESHSDMFVHPSLVKKHATSRAAVEAVIESGRMCLLSLDASAAEEVRGALPDEKCMTIFLKPPSFEEFERRLRIHLTESDESIAEYLERAKAELEEAEAMDFDHTLELDELDRAYDELKDEFSKVRPDVIVPKNENGGPMKLEAPVVVCGPSGVGKGTLINRLKDEFPDKVGFSVSHTTRKPREGEEDGVHYHFVDKAKMQEDITMGLFLEHAEVHEELYGTSIAAVQEVANAGKVCVLDIDVQGAEAVKQSQFKDAAYIFIEPPSMEALEERLRAVAEGAEAEERIATRLENAKGEMEKSKEEGFFHHVIVNDDVDVAYVELRAIVAASHPVPAPVRPMVIGGTFGTGKADMLARMELEFPGEMVVPQVTTTREPREGELPPPPAEEEEEAPPDPKAAKGAKAAAPAKGKKGEPEPPADDGEPPPPPPPPPEFAFVPREDFEAAAARGDFVWWEEVLGELYGITWAAVKRVQARNKICVLDVDRVDSCAKLRSAGRLPALYHYIAPLPHHIPAGFEDLAASELEASRAEGLFDSRSDGDDAEVAYYQFKEAVCTAYPSVVPTHSVWGYGRGVWDPVVRVHGAQPLRVVVLGPAAAGKSTQCEMLTEKFGVPWVAVGDLLQEAIKEKSEVGLRAKVYMDNTQTVPDDILIHLVMKRLAEEDCRTRGWLLDGFPHTPKQVSALRGLGVEPDKVVLIQAIHAELLERVKGRQLDPKTGKTYHVEHRPPNPEDEEVIARLTIRHDDTEDNVRARLGFYDISEEGIRAEYECVARVVSGEQSIEDLYGEIDQFVRQEARLENQVTVLESKKLTEPQYMVVEAMKFQRRSLVRLQQPDGKAFWVDLAELSTNSVCFLENTDPDSLETTAADRRLDLSAMPSGQLLFVDSPEPIHLLVSLQVGVQTPIPKGGVWPVQATKPVVMVGPSGVGKSSLIDLLVADFPDKFGFSVSHTTRAPRRNELPGVHYHFVSNDDFSDLVSDNYFLETTTAHGSRYGTGFESVDAVTREGKMCILDVDVAGARAIRKSGIDAIFIFIAPPTMDDLDRRLRGRGTESEEAIMRRMNDARAMMDEASEAGLFDKTVVNSTLLGSYSELKLVLAPHWPKRTEPRTCRLLLERFSWKDDTPGETLQRHLTFTSSTTRLSLPRGRHTLRVTTDQSFLYSTTVHSNTPFTLDEASEILKEYEGLGMSEGSGDYPDQTGSEWNVWFRYNLKLAEATEVTSQLFLEDYHMAPFSRFLSVDNDTGEETLHIVGRAPARKLSPNAHGYTLMAYSHCTLPLPSKGWRVLVGSDKPLESLDAVPNDKDEDFGAEYEPNRRGVLCSYKVGVTERTMLSLHAETDQVAAFTVTVLGPPAEEGGEGPIVKQWYANKLKTLPAIHLDPPAEGEPQGPYVIQLRLNPAMCSFDLLPNGDIAPAFETPLKWRLRLYSSKVVAVEEDLSRKKGFEDTIAKWAEADKARPATAKTVLTKWEESKAAEDKPPPVRELKDADPLELDPEKFRKVLDPAPQLWDEHGRVTEAVKDAAKLVGEDVFTSREEGMEAAKEAAAKALEEAGTHREETHAAREAEEVAKMEDFATWRAGVLTQREEAARKRAEWIASKRPPTPSSEGAGSAGA